MVAAVLRVDWLRTLVPGAPKMTLLAAFLFAAASLLVLGFQNVKRRDQFGAFLIGTLTLAILLTVVFECIRFIADYFSYELALRYAEPAHPSPCTLIGLSLVAVGGFAWAFRRWGLLRLFGWLSAGLGLLSLTGYVLSLPWLYCSFGPDDTAMSMPTAICLVILGICEALTRGFDE